MHEVSPIAPFQLPSKLRPVNPCLIASGSPSEREEELARLRYNLLIIERTLPNIEPTGVDEEFALARLLEDFEASKKWWSELTENNYTSLSDCCAAYDDLKDTLRCLFELVDDRLGEDVHARC